MFLNAVNHSTFDRNTGTLYLYTDKSVVQQNRDASAT